MKTAQTLSPSFVASASHATPGRLTSARILQCRGLRTRTLDEDSLRFYRRLLGASLPDDSSHTHNGADELVPAAILDASQSTGKHTRAIDKHSADFAWAVVLASRDEAQRLMSGLSEAGRIHRALQPTFFAPQFGIVSDRFGTFWMVVVSEGSHR